MPKQTRKGAGQIVDKSNSGGLGVSEMWVKLFEENEKWYASTRNRKRVRVDAEITEAMYVAFPQRKRSEIFKQVQKVRGRYNRGVLTGGKRPRIQSRKYLVDAKNKRYPVDGYGKPITNGKRKKRKEGR